LDKTILSVIIPIKNIGKWVNNIENNIKTFSKNSEFKYEFIFIYSLPEDKSVSKLKARISNNKFIKFCSDNGTGIYSAMNMGIKKATGSYMIFFGADDVFMEKSLLTIKEILTNNSKIDIFLFEVIVNKEKEKNLRRGSVNGGKIGRIHWLFGQPRIHQGIIYRRSFIVERLISFPTKLQVTADYIFTSIIYSFKPSVCEIDLPIAIYNLSGFSSKSTLIKNYIEHIKGYSQNKRLRKYLPLILISRIVFILYKYILSFIFRIKNNLIDI